ncbi:hypothetical protein CLOSTMETH_02974 [[Clostridium] methylpentosum DSM 5476]|uniref:Uncharacterized protein n=1 Tax=[Clostridium] methylpentosum DSM 5476 TaxID=537013 RepID=C0EGI1_9FIRM|nr:hypothetical protein CLOSTMETH_02974 [[Clostridium] methylpentosum DSM 5476]
MAQACFSTKRKNNEFIKRICLTTRLPQNMQTAQKDPILMFKRSGAASAAPL